MRKMRVNLRAITAYSGLQLPPLFAVVALVSYDSSSKKVRQSQCCNKTVDPYAEIDASA